ncbi:radical SAM family heme chaperone HemW [Segetibacter koreensis]|uniref:radical SAM family heme chaperone HemW n=1 Tax=Segetibacter koreensis TaxID=398037 RepID=UPI00035D21A6|nr:radical SAM family heme chaperone HemW [Segetibacter koreensis]
MAGVYIHIPFCRKACHYCNFHFSTTIQLREGFVNALLQEIELQKTYLSEPVTTIYFGGGTPSIFPSADIENIIFTLKKSFIIENTAEITLEANPDDITSEKLAEWKEIGINRLSIGIQSFFEKDLLWMNRAHTAQQAFDCIALAKKAGFNNLTIDLIYGTPTLSDEAWEKNVKTAIDLQVPHLSCYALTVEPKTALEKLIKQKTLADIDTEKQARHFELLMHWMQEAGYEHYEISNFAKPGFRSKHNSSYWQGKPYLGLGPSAHSFNGLSRQWNVANNALYIQSIKKGLVPFEAEVLTREQQLNEYIMTSLRTTEGISLEKVKLNFGKDKYEYLINTARPHLNHHHLTIENDYLKTTTKGKLLADGIAADLFVL